MRKNMRAWATAGIVVVVAGLGGVGAGAIALQPAKSDAKATGGSWKVDPVHSNVVYHIKHLGASNHYGMFFNPTGSMDLAASMVEITVPVSGLTSGDAKRDQHLKSPDFFNEKEFPTINFKATGVKSAGEDAYDLTGDLTLLGKTKPVTATLKVTGRGKAMGGGDVMGVEATFKIKRTDFGMEKYVKEGALGDDVSLTAALEVHKK